MFSLFLNQSELIEGVSGNKPFQITSYLKFLRSSTNGNGIHNSYVADLLFRLKKSSTLRSEFTSIEQHRNMLLHDDRVLEYQDLGAGSSRTKNTMASLAKTSLSPIKQCRQMVALGRYLEAKSILELGSSLGVSAAYMAMGIGDSTVTTVEGIEDIHLEAKKLFDQLELDNIEAILGDFDSVLPSILPEKKWDMVFIDGNHRYENTIDYFNQILPHIHEKSVLVFDDIHWSKGMHKAWESIKQHEGVTTTLDFFYYGLVIFQKSLTKEHFRLRV